MQRCLFRQGAFLALKSGGNMNLEGLEKLDQLRKKGLLSEAEFQAEKKKIMRNYASAPVKSMTYDTPRILGATSIGYAIALSIVHFVLLARDWVPNHPDLLGFSVGIQLILPGIPMLISGIVILRKKNWGRRLAIISGVIGILLVAVVWQQAIAIKSQGLEAVLRDGVMRFGNTDRALKNYNSSLGLVSFYWLLFIYPVLSIIFCLRKKKQQSGHG